MVLELLSYWIDTLFCLANSVRDRSRASSTYIWTKLIQIKSNQIMGTPRTVWHVSMCIGVELGYLTFNLIIIYLVFNIHLTVL